MQFTIQPWPLEKLLELIEKTQIDLKPPYQRNPIWTAKAQRKLIETILLGHPIPNFFILEKENGTFEMVDGQQRARTVYAYWTNNLIDLDHLTWDQRMKISGYSKETKDLFLKYEISVTLIRDLEPSENIEQFYALVNSSGLRLNRPELRKASYYNTVFLALLLELAENEDLSEMQLFGSSSLARMQDFELISEIVTSLKFGVIDKKDKVDQLYEDDISEQEAEILRKSFLRIVSILKEFDEVQPIRRTRYKQKGDFYSIFLFLHALPTLPIADLIYLYQVLIKLAPHIRPSNSDCAPLQEYAYYCTTQSNSKRSRSERHAILNELLANTLDKPNQRQNQLLDYFKLSDKDLVKIGPFLTLNFGSITDPNQMEWDFDAFFNDEV